MIKKTKVAEDLTAQIVELALDKKAENVISIDIKEITTLTDSFIICSADTDVQVKAISDNIRKNTPYKPIRTEGYEHLKWVILDYIDVMVHIFKTAERANIGEVVVATEDKEIFDDVKQNGGQAILTKKKHNTGTDRIHEAFEMMDN